MTGRQRTLLVCVCAAVLLVVIALSGSLCTQAAQTTNFDEKNLFPSFWHIFGTDWLGRDMFLRTIAGLSTSIFIGCLAALASSVISLVLGCAAATSRKLDAAISWLIDLMMGIPHLILLVLISYALGRGFLGVAVGIALTHWANLARIVRAEVLQCKNSQYVKIAGKLGQSKLQIARRHMLPYVLPQFLVGLVLMFPHAILHEAAITFLGFGLGSETPAIGVILSESMTYLSTGCWHLATFPGLALVLVVFLFDYIGKSLRKLTSAHTAQF